MISMTKDDAAALQLELTTPRTATCPKCDGTAKVQQGVSVPHVCACGNVWQPNQLFGQSPTCISCAENGAADRIMAGFIVPLGPMPTRQV